MKKDKPEEYELPKEEEDKMNKEWQDFMDEDAAFDITAANQDTFQDIKGVLLNTTQEFKDQFVNGVLIASASRYDEWCKSFEEALPE
jgi:hypothetical protein